VNPTVLCFRLRMDNDPSSSPPDRGPDQVSREQFRRLRPDLTDLGVELSTVDSVQGREKEVVVILTTKNDLSPDEADFLDDYRRLNVAVSRCRHGQFIFGNAKALRALPMWNRLLNWAESIRSVIRMADVNRYIYSIHPEPRHWAWPSDDEEA
uniref:AAA_12 domain-containing protein n=1 Tax=Haemonchus contortus TaxID=6289 RepID=A0A7I4YVU8_HAECO